MAWYEVALIALGINVLVVIVFGLHVLEDKWRRKR